QLTWNDNSNNELGFYVERSIDSTSWSTIATLNPDEVSYLDQGLSAGIYYYMVSAFNIIGTSIYSNTVKGNTDETSAIDDILLTEEMMIYPKTCKGRINIDNSKQEKTNIDIFNIPGEKVFTKVI